MEVIGVDVGYGYTKGISGNGDSVIFPSVVGTGFERKIEKMLNGGTSDSDYHDLIIKGISGETQHFFIGNLAILQSPDAARPFSDDRSKAEEITPALLTAIAALSRGEKVTLVTGLPLEPFQNQAIPLKTSLERMSGVQVVLNGQSTVIEFEQVIMFPQAIAAMYAVLKRNNNLGSSGVIGLIDMGFRTTDIIMFDLAEKRLMGRFKETIPHGMNDIVVAVQDKIKEQSGGYTPNLETIEQALIKKRPLFFDKQEYNVSEIAAKQEKGLKSLIVSNVKRRWRDKQKELKMVYLAGGGALILQAGISEFAESQLVHDAQFANAKGYLLKGLADQENRICATA